jgi:hypothetical protein
VENRECRLIFVLERAGKQKARFLEKKAGTIPEMERSSCERTNREGHEFIRADRADQPTAVPLHAKFGP